MKTTLLICICFVSVFGMAQPPDYMDLYHKADFQNWESCETGEGECNKIVLSRFSTDQDVYIEVPSGGTAGTCKLYANKQALPIQTLDSSHDSKSRKFNLSALDDGFYYMSMLSCGLGGTVQIELKTK